MNFEIIGDLFFEVIVPWLIMVPGAFLRWIMAKIRGVKKTYREYYRAGSALTGFYGVLFYVVLIYLIFRF